MLYDNLNSTNMCINQLNMILNIYVISKFMRFLGKTTRYKIIKYTTYNMIKDV